MLAFGEQEEAVPFLIGHIEAVEPAGVDGPEGGLEGLPYREPAFVDERIIEQIGELQISFI